MKTYTDIVQSLGITDFLEQNAEAPELKGLYKKIKMDILDLTLENAKNRLVFFSSNLACEGLNSEKYDELRNKLLKEGFTEREVMELVSASTLGYIIDSQYKEKKVNRIGILKKLFNDKKIEYLENSA